MLTVKVLPPVGQPNTVGLAVTRGHEAHVRFGLCTTKGARTGNLEWLLVPKQQTPLLGCSGRKYGRAELLGAAIVRTRQKGVHWQPGSPIDGLLVVLRMDHTTALGCMRIGCRGTIPLVPKAQPFEPAVPVCMQAFLKVAKQEREVSDVRAIVRAGMAREHRFGPDNATAEVGEAERLVIRAPSSPDSESPAARGGGRRAYLSVLQGTPAKQVEAIDNR